MRRSTESCGSHPCNNSGDLDYLRKSMLLAVNMKNFFPMLLLVATLLSGSLLQVEARNLPSHIYSQQETSVQNVGDVAIGALTKAIEVCCIVWYINRVSFHQHAKYILSNCHTFSRIWVLCCPTFSSFFTVFCAYILDDVIVDCRMQLVISSFMIFALELRRFSNPFQVLAHCLQV